MSREYQAGRIYVSESSENEYQFSSWYVNESQADAPVVTTQLNRTVIPSGIRISIPSGTKMVWSI